MEYGKDLEQLMNELAGDKLEQEPPRSVLEPEQEVEGEDAAPASNDAESEDTPNIKDINGLPELIVGVIDIFAATIAEAWTQTDDKSKYRLTTDEKEELIRAWKMYLQNSDDLKISPSTMLLLTTGIIYSPKLITAINERKARRQGMQSTNGAKTEWTEAE